MVGVGEPFGHGNARRRRFLRVGEPAAIGVGGVRQDLHEAGPHDGALLLDLAADEEIDVASLVGCGREDRGELRLRHLGGMFLDRLVNPVGVGVRGTDPVQHTGLILGRELPFLRGRQRGWLSRLLRKGRAFQLHRTGHGADGHAKVCSAVPEPSSLALLAAVGFFLVIWKIAYDRDFV